MSNYQAELNKASKTVQKQISETEEKIGEVQSEFAKTLDVMSRAAMSRATAEVELGLKLSQKLTAARSPADALSAYQEWLTEEMKARADDARQFMTNCQRFITEGTRLFSNSGSNGRMSR
jgi:peptidoglycan hydrolase CwlO-like protein